MSSPRLLIVCSEPVGARMAGPAIRAVELARAVVSSGAGATIAAPRGEGAAPLPTEVTHVPLANGILRRELAEHTCVLVGATLLTRFPSLRRAQVPLAVDLYVPVGLEAGLLFADAPPSVLRATLAEASATLKLELSRADQVFCSTARQRDLWLGAAMTCGRVPSTEDGSDFVKVVPFGVPDDPPQAGAPAMREVVEGIGAEDQIALWAGGLHEWLDPELVIEAVRRLVPATPGLRLVFLGASPPNSALQEHSAESRARLLAEQSGLLGKHVFFLEGWVPYSDRGRYLVEADIGVSAHRDTLETRFSWRTRLLDYVWAGLPTAATSGDELSERMAAAGAAQLAPTGDAETLAGAISSLLAPGERRGQAIEATAVLASELRWVVVAAPLLDWIRGPSRTAAKASAIGASLRLWRMLGAKAWHMFQREGVSGVKRRARRFSDRP